MAPNKQLLQAIAVTAELTQTSLSEPAAKVMATDLAEYPLPWVLKALVRCRRELKGRMSIADVIQRIDDGRPGPEEAWAMVPKDELGSVVWTVEMAEAFGICQPLMETPIPARMAFLEAYRERVRVAREEKRIARWMPSLGHDPLGREQALSAAVVAGRISHKHAQSLITVTDGITIEDVKAKLLTRGEYLALKPATQGEAA